MFLTPIKLSEILTTLIIIIVIFFTIWFINNIGSIRPKNPILYHFIFDNISGLSINDTVKISGLPMGSIKKINLIKNKAFITVEIPSKVVLYKYSKAIIKSKSLLGEKYLEISIGEVHNMLVANSIIINNFPTLDINQVLQEIGILCTRCNLIIDVLYKKI